MPVLVLKFVFSVVAVLMGFTVHEFSHALLAYKLGDPTQKYEGRLTLNPFKHLDWFGAAVLVISMIVSGGRCVFGWGKPVAICREALNNPTFDSGLCSFAGPFANLCLAIAAGLPVKLGLVSGIPLLPDFLAIVAGINIALFVFNMLPIPPLDGWKSLQIIVPEGVADKMLDMEKNIGPVPMYCIMGAIVLVGPFFIAPIYIKIVELFVGYIPFSNL